jgi:hypothetical protein
MKDRGHGESGGRRAITAKCDSNGNGTRNGQAVGTGRNNCNYNNSNCPAKQEADSADRAD